jgi:hypothetical protein
MKRNLDPSLVALMLMAVFWLGIDFIDYLTRHLVIAWH